MGAQPDRLAAIQQRLANGQHIADEDIRDLLSELARVRAENADLRKMLEGVEQQADGLLAEDGTAFFTDGVGEWTIAQLRARAERAEQALREAQDIIRGLLEGADDYWQTLPESKALIVRAGAALAGTAPAPAPTYESLRRKIHAAMRAVCAGCNHGVEMDCYNKHRGGRDCEAVRYRDVLALMGYSHVENPVPAEKEQDEVQC